MAELNVGTVVADLELRDRNFGRAVDAAQASLNAVGSAAEAAGASTARAMAPAASALSAVVDDAQRATDALVAIGTTDPFDRITLGAQQALAQIDRLEKVSGNAAAAETARAAVMERAAAQTTALLDRQEEAAKRAAAAQSQAAAATAAAAAEAARETQRIADAANDATLELQKMAATPMQRIAIAANEASREIDRLEKVSGNAAAAEAARAALAQRTAAALGQAGKQEAQSAKGAQNWANIATQSFYQLSDAASQLSSGTPFTTVLIQQGGQLLPVLAGMGSALAGIASILAPVALAAGALGVAYAYVSKEVDTANEKLESSRKILEQWQAAAKSTGGVIDNELRRKIAVAYGDMRESEAAAQSASEAYKAQKQPLLDAAAAQTQMAQATADAILAQIKAKAANEDVAELMLLQSDRYRKAQATVEEYRAKQARLAAQIDETASLVGTLAAEEVADSEAAAKASAAHKANASALKDHAAEAKKAAAELRAFVALYEQAAEVVYARREVPGADLFEKAQKLIESMVPPKALTAFEKLDLLSAEIAANFSKGAINADQFAALTEMVTKARSQKFGLDLGSTLQEQAAAAMQAQQEIAGQLKEFYAGLADKMLGQMGKLGSLVSSVVQGAQTGGVWGALIAGLVELLSSSLKLQRVVDAMDGALEQLAAAFDPLIDAIHLLGSTDTMTLKSVFDALGPVFQFVADAVAKVAPFAVQLGSFLQILGPIFGFLMEALQPLLSVIDSLARTLYKLVGSLMGLVGTVLGALMQQIQMLAPALSLLELSLRPIMGILDLLVEGINFLIGGITDIVQWVVTGIQKAYNWIVNQIESLLAAVGVEIDIPRMDVSAMFEAMDALTSQSYDAAMAQAEQNARVEESTDRFDKLNESLSNVPTGFKVAQKAFEAAAAAVRVGGGSVAGYVTPAEGLGYGSRQTVSYSGGGMYLPQTDQGGASTVIYIDRLEVNADDAEGLVAQLQAIAGRKLFARTGSTVGSGLPFASVARVP